MATAVPPRATAGIGFRLNPQPQTLKARARIIKGQRGSPRKGLDMRTLKNNKVLVG
jgi:hypothetical protein